MTIGFQEVRNSKVKIKNGIESLKILMDVQIS